MSKLDKHPTVLNYLEKKKASSIDGLNKKIDTKLLRDICIESGADDVGFVEVERDEIADEKDDILHFFPYTKTLVGFVCRMNREPIRSKARSIANLEFHTTGDKVNEVAHGIVSALEAKGIRAVNPSMGFPMEMDRFPGKIWVVSHKKVAVAAGLGQMGIHRNVIHPKFGNFILLGTVLMDAEVSSYDDQIDYNPCLECKLCVAACPVGAIGSDGYFNFSACYTHNYREFLSGFTNWIEQVSDSRSSKDYRERVNDSESVSMWQSLSYGANYKAAYCMSVCPAGEDVIGSFIENRTDYLKDVVRPLQDREEMVYVVPGSDAEEYVPSRFPNKSIKQVSNSLRPKSIRDFFEALPLIFQPKKAGGLEAIYHFTFTGDETHKATVKIKNKAFKITRGHYGSPDVTIFSDSGSWIKFISKEANIMWLLLTRKIRVVGSLKLFRDFGRCFPS